MESTYGKLIAPLDRHGAAYQLIDHPPEGQTDKVSALRGHPVAAAAKCIVLIAKLGKKATRFVLAVVPGDARVDTGRVRALLGASHVGFAAADVAERLAGSVAGTVPPFVPPRPDPHRGPVVAGPRRDPLRRRPPGPVRRPAGVRLPRARRTAPGARRGGFPAGSGGRGRAVNAGAGRNRMERDR